MPVQSIDIMMNASSVASGAQVVAGGTRLIDNAFIKIIETTKRYNAAGQLVGQTWKGIGANGEDLVKTLTKIKNGWATTTLKMSEGRAEQKAVAADLRNFNTQMERLDNEKKAREKALTLNLKANVDERNAVQKYSLTLAKEQAKEQEAIDKRALANLKANIDARTTAQKTAILLAREQAKEQVTIDRAATALKARGQNIIGQSTSASIGSTVGASFTTGTTGKTASNQELFNYNKSLAGLKAFAQENGVSTRLINRMWEDVGNGSLKPYTGRLGDLQSKLFNVHKAINDVGSAHDQLTAASKGFHLSWQSIARFFEARLLYNAIDSMRQALVSSVDRASEFELVLGRIRTLTPEINGTFNDWGDSVKRISTAFGLDAQDVATSYYTALSNQIGNSIQEIESFTRVTAEFARTTGATAQQSNDLFASAINAFKLGANDSQAIAGKFFKAIDLGRITAAGLSGSFGRVAVAAHTIGVSLDETLAALSTLSRQGVTDADAMTQVLNIMNKLLKPTDELQKLFTKWGYASGQAIIANEGLTGVLKRFDTEIQTGGGARLGELINDIRGLRGTFGLTGEGLKEFQSDLGNITNSQQDYNRAIAVTTDTMGFKWLKQLNAVKTAFTTLGQGIISFLTPVIESFGGLVTIIKAATGAAIIFGSTMITNIIASRVAVAALTATELPSLLRMFNTIKNGILLIFTPAKILGLVLGVLTSIVLLAESTSEKIKRVYAEATEANAKALQESIAATSKHFDELAINFKISLKPFFDTAARIRAAFSNEIESIQIDLDKVKLLIDNLSQNTMSALSDAISESKSRMSGFANVAKEIQKNLDSAFKNDAIYTFKETLDGLSSGKQAKALQKEIAAAITMAGELAKQAQSSIASGLPSSETERLFKESQAQTEYALSLKQDLITASKAAAREEKTSKQEFLALSAKDNESMQRELDLRRKIGTVANEIAANAKRPGSRENGNDKQLLLASQLEGHQKELNKLIADKEVARAHAETAKRDNAGIDINKQLVSLHEQITGAYERQLEVAKELQKIEQDKIAVFEKQQSQLKIAFDKTSFLLTGDISKKTRGDIQGEIDGILKEYNRATALIQETMGSAFHPDTTGLYQLQDILGKIADKADRQKKVQNTDDITNKGRKIEEESIKRINDLKEKSNVLDNLRSDSVNKLIGQIEGLGTVRPFQLAGGNAKDISETIGAYDKTVSRLKEIAITLKENPKLIGQFSEELNVLGRSFDALQGGEKVRFSSAKLPFLDSGTDKLQTLLTTRSAISAAVDFNDRIKALSIEEQSLIAQQNELANAYKNAGLEGTKSVDTVKDSLRALIQELNTYNLQIATPTTSVPEKRAGGGKMYGSDKIGAMLSPGEFVVNAGASRRFYSQLVAMNSGSRNYAGGGTVNTSVGDVNINMSSSGNSSTDVVRIGKLLRREIKRGTVRL